MQSVLEDYVLEVGKTVRNDLNDFEKGHIVRASRRIAKVTDLVGYSRNAGINTYKK